MKYLLITLALAATFTAQGAIITSANNTTPLGCPAADSGEIAFCNLADSLIGAGHSQSNLGAFSMSGIASTATLRFEEASGKNINQVGIWWMSTNDTASLQKSVIFTGPAGAPGGSLAVLDTFLNPGFLTVTGAGPGVNSGTIAGFNPNFFGLYALTGAGTFYSLQALNADGFNRFGLRTNAGPTGTAAWGLDDGGNSPFRDTNDAVGTLESFKAGNVPNIPEPGTWILSGLALMGLGLIRNRQSKN